MNIIQKWKDHDHITVHFQGQFPCTNSDGQGLSGGGATGQLGGYCGLDNFIRIILQKMTWVPMPIKGRWGNNGPDDSGRPGH